MLRDSPWVISGLTFFGGLAFVAWQALFTIVPALFTWVTTPTSGTLVAEGALFFGQMIPAFKEWLPASTLGFVAMGVGWVGVALFGGSQTISDGLIGAPEDSRQESTRDDP